MKSRIQIILFKNENEEFTRMLLNGVTEIQDSSGSYIRETNLADINLISNDNYEVVMLYD